MKKIQIYNIVKKYPFLIGLVLIAMLMGGLLVQRYLVKKQETQATIVPEELARQGTIEQFQNPADLIEYTMAALKNKDMDLVLRACAINENLLGNPFYNTLEREEKFSYSMTLPPSADYEEYRPLSSAIVTGYYTEQYDEIQEQLKDLENIKLKKVGVLYPEIQLNPETLSETVENYGEWGADMAIQMSALLGTDQGDYMISFTVTKYYGYWKLFNFTAEMSDEESGHIIKATSQEDYEMAIGEISVLDFVRELNNELSEEEDIENQAQVIDDIEHPEKEILPPNYFIVGMSYGKEQEDTIQKFILALQKKNPTEALSYCNMGNSIKNLHTVTSEQINTQANYAKQLSYFYYGLLGEPYFSGEKRLIELGETARDILNKLNPQFIPYMNCTKILKVSEDKSSNEEQYVALYAFNGNHYMSGYTLRKLDEGWQIISLSSSAEGLAAGEVKEVPLKTYQWWKSKD